MSFDNSSAGRQQLKRSFNDLDATLLQVCLPPRGSGAGLAAAIGDSPLTASVCKREVLLASFFDRMLPVQHADDDSDTTGFDAVIKHLPSRIQKHFRVLECVVDRLRRALGIWKNLRSKEARTSYRVISAAAMPPRVGEGDQAGLMRAVTSLLDIPRVVGSVPHQAQLVRDEWDEAVAKAGLKIFLPQRSITALHSLPVRVVTAAKRSAMAAGVQSKRQNSS